ncbi:hypothetical protein [Lentzea pudingi]|uniref:hypothetical protein n=1 Tax=Lentzea pudingi TaxID=1789439 RepID=UPI00166D2823|nr:hypothetical protein [Lentzea pudingi]
MGIEWTGDQPLTILVTENVGLPYDGASKPLHRYTPIEVTVDVREPDLGYSWRVHDLAQDCVNQVGVSYLCTIHPPKRNE